MRVLLVDDDPRVLQTTVALLEALEHRVVSVHDGKQALGALGSADFDLVLSDVQMPVMDGIELARRVADDWPELPVLLMTGNPDQLQRVGPGVPVMTKPFGLSGLRAAIDRLS